MIYVVLSLQLQCGSETANKIVITRYKNRNTTACRRICRCCVELFFFNFLFKTKNKKKNTSKITSPFTGSSLCMVYSLQFSSISCRHFLQAFLFFMAASFYTSTSWALSTVAANAGSQYIPCFRLGCLLARCCSRCRLSMSVHIILPIMLRFLMYQVAFG